MTEGKISKSIFLFALPIFFGNLFQQLYNIVDSLVVGNVLGKEALAAVTSTGSLIFLIIGFLGGIFVGSGVIISRFFGAKEFEKMSIAIHTTIAFSILAGIGVTVIGMIGTPIFLRWMGTPEDVMGEAIVYLRLYFLGGVSMVVYNACVGVFQAVGDSRRPLYYLITAAITNTILDLIFVAYLGLGIGGAAIATTIAQTLSAVLAIHRLTKVNKEHKLTLKNLSIDFKMLKRLLNMGIPSGVQNSVIAFANVIIQSYINMFGSIAMAGSGSYSKLEGFAFLPITSFSMALTTFVGQNMGAKKFDRVRKGAKFGILSGVIIAEVIGIIIWLFAPFFISFFNTDSLVVENGVLRAKIISLFFFLLALSHLLAGILRGLGKTKIPMFVMLLCWCFIRIGYVKIMIYFIRDIRVVYWAYPLTWALSSICFVIYYRKNFNIESLATKY